MKALLVSIAVMSSVLFSSAQTTKWELDKAHTTISFRSVHLLISKVTGHFEEYDATIHSDREDFSDLKVEFTAKVASLNTGIEMRDNHLKSDDFFNAEKYPNITFKSTSFKKIGDGKYKLAGQLTIRDVTKPIELDVTYGGTIKDPYGKTRAGFEITGKLNRFDYGLKWNAALETGGLVVGEMIDIICSVEIIKQ
ncbi:MAG TPA: YceI family protein [Chitinophagales bacterium]|nr:YceI family protein [Chitinophagales bacterium]